MQDVTELWRALSDEELTDLLRQMAPQPNVADEATTNLAAGEAWRRGLIALAADLAEVTAKAERFRHALLIAQGDAEPETIENYEPLRDSDWCDLAAPDGDAAS